MNRTKKIILRALMTGAALTTLAEAANAQTTTSIVEPQAAQTGDTRSDQPSNDVIVTASKRAERLKDVPMSVDVVTGAQLEKLNLFDFKNIAALAPGLTLTSTGRNTTATLRGISFNPDIGGPAAVAVYLNEVPVDINIISTAMYDVQQVEVLRGPQGTLRGKTAPAGAITITTRHADLNEVKGQLQATGSNRGARNLQGAVSVPIVDGKLALRVAGLWDRNWANQTYNLTLGERAFQDTESVRATLSFAPASNFTGNIIYQYLDSYLTQSAQVFGTGNQPSLLSPFVNGPAITPEQRLSVAGGRSFYSNHSHLLSADFRWKLGDYAVSALVGYQRANLYTVEDQDTGNAIDGYSQNLTVPNPTKNFTAELRIDSEYRGMFNFTIGAFYNRNLSHSISDFDVSSFYARPANLGGLPPTVATPYPAAQAMLPLNAHVNIFNNSSDLAAFAAARFQFTDRLKLELGARFTHNVAYAQSYLTVSSPGTRGATPFTLPAFTNPNNQATVKKPFDDQTANPFTGTASISYDWTPDVTTYVSYGRSFRRGSAQLGVTSLLDPSLLVLKPERSDSIELGLKSQLFDHHLSLNLSAYYQKFDGFIGLTSARTSSARNGVIDSGTATLSYNAPAITKGIEAQIDARVSQRWSLQVSASYNKSRYDNARIPCNDFNGDGTPDSIGTPFVPVGQQVSFCTSSDRLVNAPDFSASGTSEYHVPIGSVEAFARGLLVYRPSFFIVASNFTIPSAHTLSLFFGVRGSSRRWELSVFAKNALNEQRITAVGPSELRYSTNSSAAPFLSHYKTVSIGQPREFGATFSLNF